LAALRLARGRLSSCPRACRVSPTIVPGSSGKSCSRASDTRHATSMKRVESALRSNGGTLMINSSTVQALVRWILDRSRDGAAFMISELVDILGAQTVRDYVDAFDEARKDADRLADDKFGPKDK